MLYIMNTRTKVPTDAPETNEFGHDSFEGKYPVQFVYLVNAETGGSPKVYAAYGTGPQEQVGRVAAVTQDTGLGNRAMADHRVVAIKTRDGIEGTLPKGKTIAFWVAK